MNGRLAADSTRPAGAVLPPSAPGSEGGQIPQLVYVVGHHKSGATVLGAVLAGHPSIFYAGELYRFPVPIWIPGTADRLCSCGSPAIACPFWSGLRNEVDQGHRLEALRAGQNRFERWSALLRTLLADAHHAPELERHGESMRDFVRSIAARAGARVVVESSLSALRGLVYRSGGSRPLAVRYLHLVRDGRGFLFSERRLGPDEEVSGAWLRLPPVVVVRWIAQNLLAMLLCGGDRDRYLRVRYEDLVGRPRETLERIGRFIGVDLGEVIGRVERADPIPMRHIAAGNRARLRGSVVLRHDTGWEEGLPKKEKLLFWIFAGWLARLYGYRWRPAAGV